MTTHSTHPVSRIEVLRHRARALALVDVLVDGVPFPYPILDDHVEVTLGKDGAPSFITVSIPCERITVDEPPRAQCPDVPVTGDW